ncbi:MAG: hypothetical protein BRC33_11335 [Cyanobacteria bacterium SW_9_44_58]|nr:MAG: hypothetical protein BRC33_11335 [Cyanobacteria bacterium SW_9_44_58]
MFEQFHRYFPRGCLISELVQIDHGKYIVRASVQNEGLTLATGLAAAETVEKAEDQARTRALAVLDISLTPAQPHADSSLAQAQTKESASQATAVTASASPQPRATAAEQHQSSSVPAASAKVNSSQTTLESEPNAAFSETETKTEAIKDKPAVLINNTSSTQETTDSNDEPASGEPLDSSVGSSDSEEMTMDYSDIIARTNVELKRLQWTNEQGRKFLEETYGKRSRSLLSESELLEFLQYLEKQPTPPQQN